MADENDIAAPTAPLDAMPAQIGTAQLVKLHWLINLIGTAGDCQLEIGSSLFMVLVATETSVQACHL